MSKKKLRVLVTRKLPDATETRLMELFDVKLNINDEPMSQEEMDFNQEEELLTLYDEEGNEITLEYLAAEYTMIRDNLSKSTKDDYIYRIPQQLGTLARKPINEITVDDFVAWWGKAKAKGSRKVALRYVSSLYTYAIARKYVTENIAKDFRKSILGGIPASQPKQTHIPKDELEDWVASFVKQSVPHPRFQELWDLRVRYWNDEPTIRENVRDYIMFLLVTGKRKGEQVFGSILYGAEFNNEITLSPYGRIDVGHTKLKSYSDSGTVAAINYNEQKIKTARASIGILIDDEIQTKKATFMPNARIEYGKDVVDASDAVLSYIVYPNIDYTLKIDREETDNFRIGFGTDVLVKGGWILSLDFERNQKESSSYENSINLGASFNPNPNTEYSVSIIGGNSSNRQFGFDYDKSFTDDWTLNASFEAAKSSNSSYNNTIGLSTKMTF